jgi:hypothetical protein
VADNAFPPAAVFVKTISGQDPLSFVKLSFVINGDVRQFISLVESPDLDGVKSALDDLMQEVQKVCLK